MMKIEAKFTPGTFPIRLYVEGEPTDYTLDEAKQLLETLGKVIGEAEAYGIELQRYRDGQG